MQWPAFFALGVLLWVASSTAARARLDETYSQCAQRYGEAAQGKGSAEAVFQKEPLSVVVHFDSGKAVRLEYVHPLLLPLSEENVAGLLKANSGGAEWKILKSTDSGRLHFCPQKRYYAYYHGPGGGVAALVLFTEGEFKREMALPSKATVVPEELHKLFKSPEATITESLQGF